VGTPQVVVTVALIVLLGGVGVFFVYRQLKTMRRLRSEDHGDEEGYFHSQTKRRLFSAILLVLMALMLIGSLILEGPAHDLENRIDAAGEGADEVRNEDGNRLFAKFYAGYWIVFLLTLMTVLVLAFWDLLAIRGYATRQFAKLRAARREMIEQEVARYRSERNGHAGD
jgi:hypothetical protein